METLNYNEEQRIVLNLPGLTQKDQPGNEMLGSTAEAKRDKGEVSMVFCSEDYEPVAQPSPEQLEALDFIKNHEAELVEAFFKYTKEVLYPTHIEFIGFDEINFPEIHGVKDLRKSLGINDIYIWPQHKEGVSYVAYYFDFTGDFEHGVYLIAHKTRILGWEEDLVFDKVEADK